ncbi:MAG TPA: GNAT family N-acetyltransferase [Opitutaceae bacterium]|jgi:GNAT superfamily N-acetyltransferase
MLKAVPFTIRRVEVADADAIAAVHVASIRSVGARGYPPEIVNEWGAPRDGRRYREAMQAGKIYFLAIRGAAVLGFASWRTTEDGQHRIAVYIDGRATRQGAGTALYRAAEGVAALHGATEIHVDASLAAIDFYLANGFEKQRAGEHPLASGARMACVFMQKRISPPSIEAVAHANS